MAKRWLAALLIATGCAGSDADEPRTVPSDAVLCHVWAGNEPESQFELRVYGTLDSDVIAAWGEPSSRSGNVWTYEWTRGTVTLTFERADLCYDVDKSISGNWVSDIEGDGVSGGSCWIGELRNKEPTCDGCLNAGEVEDCR